MTPVLYAANETDFNHNGIGALSDCTSCTVTEERNGIYECEFFYPITGAFYSEISPDRIIKVKASEYADGQLFRIYRSSKPLNGIVKFYCQHISYDLSTNVVNPFKATGVGAAVAMTRVLENCYYQHRFTATSTSGAVSTIDVKVPTPARSCLGGMRGSILDNFGGEFEFDNFVIKLHQRRGQDNGVTILYGKNLTDIKADTNLQDTYAAVYPYATDTDGNTTVLAEKVIETATFGNYGEPKVLALDLSDKFSEEEITEAKIRQYAQNYINNNKIQDIYQNIEISFVQLWQTEEYKNIALLERVGLCDTVTVKYPALGVSVKAKVVKTVYDVLKEKYQKIELGQARSNFGDSLKKLDTEIKDSIVQNQSAMQKAIDNATKLITGQDGGYVVMNATADGHPYEILIMNTDDIQTATKLWRWNLGGLGYSSTGYNGQYGTAITMDGAIVADYITTGTLNAGLIKTGIIEDEQHTNYWNMNTGEFKLSDGTTDAIKLSNGNLTINASFIKSGAINANLITTGNLSAARITTGILQDDNGTNYWNLDTGEFRLSANTKVGTASSNTPLSSYVSSSASAQLTQQNVFNALTNNGALQGVYMSGGELYINGTYIKTGAIDANLITTGTISSTNSRTKFDLSNGQIALNLSNDSWLTDSGRLELDAFGITLFDSATGTNDIGALTNIKVVDAQSGTTTIKSKIITDYGEISNLEATKISSVSELNGHPLQRILQTINGVNYYVWGYQAT